MYRYFKKCCITDNTLTLDSCYLQWPLSCLFVTSSNGKERWTAATLQVLFSSLLEVGFTCSFSSLLKVLPLSSTKRAIANFWMLVMYHLFLVVAIFLKVSMPQISPGLYKWMTDSSSNNSSNKFSWFILNRLTPPYMFCLLFFDKMMGFLGEGPMWYEAQAENPCDKYWWTNLLYINNFYPTTMNNSVRVYG